MSFGVGGDWAVLDECKTSLRDGDEDSGRRTEVSLSPSTKALLLNVDTESEGRPDEQMQTEVGHAHA